MQRTFWSYAKEHKTSIAFIVILSLGTSLFSACMPFINRMMLDQGLMALNLPVTALGAAGLLAVSFLGRLCEYVENKAELSMCYRIGVKWKRDAFEHAMNLRPGYYKENGVFRIVRDATFDIECILGIAQNYLLKVVVYLMRAGGAVIGLFLLNWKLSLIILLAVPLQVGLNTILSKLEERYANECVAQNKRYNQWFNDFISGIFDVKLWGLEKRKIKEYDEILRDTAAAQNKSSLLNGKSTLLFSVLQNCFTYGLYIAGILLVMRGELTLGSLLSFVSFSAYFFSPVDILLNVKRMLGHIAPNVKSLERFYALQEEDDGAKPELTQPIKTISFCNVSVKLGDKVVLQDVSFELHRGEKVLLVGENGSGKSTLLNLLLRIYEPDAGEIRINGTPVSAYRVGSYRKRFSVVAQEVYLFSGTIRDNICLDRAADEAAFPAFCSRTIERLPDGYDTVVGINGSMVSGGERQKVALLRALNRKQDVLIMDEPTSNYDAASEKAFHAFVAQMEDYGFHIVVSHRRELEQDFDVVLRVRDNQVEVSRKEL